MIVVATTGGMIAFEAELRPLLNRDYWRVEPQGEPLPYDTLMAKAFEAEPDLVLWGMMKPEQPDHSVYFYGTVAPEKQSKYIPYYPTVFLNPYTGDVLGVRGRYHNVLGFAYLIHRTLVAGEIGRYIVAASAFVLCLMMLSGMYLWLPRTVKQLKNRLGVKFSRGWKRLNYDVHGISGMVLAVPLLFMASTGIFFTFYAAATSAVYAVTFSEKPAPPPTIDSVEDGKRISINEAIALAEAEIPGRNATYVNMMDVPGRPWSVTLRAEDAWLPYGRTRVYIDPYEGNVLQTDLPEENNRGEFVMSMIYPFHTGEIGGMPLRIAWFIGCFTVPTLGVTGFVHWWNRTKNKKKKPATEPAEPEPLRSISPARADASE